MPEERRSLLLHERWTEAERWAYSTGCLLAMVLVRRLVLPADFTFVFLPFAIVVPAVYYVFGRWPGIVFLPLSGLAALLMSDASVLFTARTLLGFALYIGYGVPVCWMIDRSQLALMRLREMEGLKSAVLDAQTDWVMRFDDMGRFVYVNEATCTAFGLKPTEALGKSWKLIVLEEDWITVEERLAVVTPENPVTTGENRLLNARGDVIWGQFINRGLFDLKGNRIGLQSVGRDITERKQLESQLANAAREMEDLYENAPCAYYALDAEGYVIKANRAMCELLGVPAEDLVGKRRLLEFYTPASAEIFRSQYAAFKARGTLRGHEIVLIDGRGRERTVLVDSNVVYDGPGEFLYSRAVMTDITERKAAEAEVQRLNAELARRIEGQAS